MSNFLTSYYLWIKALHIIFVLFWMAGMFYLPRLFAYHADAKIGSEYSEKLKVMERRYFKIIMNPSMIMSFGFGILLLCTPGVLVSPLGWLHLKIFLLFIMAGLHGYFAFTIKIFQQDQNRKKSYFFRILNEVPPLVAAAIIILVVIKPF